MGTYHEAKTMAPDATITAGELRKAVTAVLLEQFDDVSEGESETIGTDILKYILDARERTWRIGDVVRAADDVVWQRTVQDMWLRLGDGRPHGHLIPNRPLKLLDSPMDGKDAARRLAALERARADGAPI